jgi:hypothetical protein
MRLSTDLTIWLAAVSSIGVYSFLYKENPVSRFIEHLFIGLGAGYGLVMGFTNLQTKAFGPIASGKNPMMIVPMVLGALLFARFVPQYRHLGRIPIALMTGVGTALTLRGTVVADFVGQVRAGIMPVNSINSLIMVAGTVGTLMYFFFTTKKNEVVSAGATIGKYIMMVTFGAGFGNATMGRISQLIGRLDLILGQWLGLYVR